MQISYRIRQKNRRQIIYGKIKADIGKMLRQLCEYKGIEIIEAEACKDHMEVKNQNVLPFPIDIFRDGDSIRL